MDPADRAYLARLVAADTGTAAPDAERRVDEVAARAKQAIARARSSAVILAFMAGAATLLGAIAAWTAAVTAGRHRDERERIPYLWIGALDQPSRALKDNPVPDGVEGATLSPRFQESSICLQCSPSSRDRRGCDDYDAALGVKPSRQVFAVSI